VIFRLWGNHSPGWFGNFVFVAGLLNIVLALFNMLPVPPLDGSALLERVLPDRWWPTYLKFRRYSFFLLLALMLLFATRSTSPIFEPAWWLWLRMAT
jgi:Zn-dependent protease